MSNMCEICEQETTFLTRRKIANKEIVCEQCIKRAKSLTFKESISLRRLTVDRVKESILESNERGEDVLNFIPTNEIGNFIKFDDINELILVPGGFLNNDIVYNYNNIIDFELLEDGESVASGGLGRALVGGALFGGTGAIVGGVTGKRKNKEFCSSLRIKITLNDINNPTIYINFINSKTKTNSFTYKTLFNSAQDCLSVLQIITNKENGTNNEEQQFNGQSNADEIRKFKELLDEGIISEEEFELKKKELLK